MKVSRTTRLSAIRYTLSRQATDGADRKAIVTNGRFDGHTLDQDIETICGSNKSCTLDFAA